MSLLFPAGASALDACRSSLRPRRGPVSIFAPMVRQSIYFTQPKYLCQAEGASVSTLGRYERRMEKIPTAPNGYERIVFVIHGEGERRAAGKKRPGTSNDAPGNASQPRGDCTLVPFSKARRESPFKPAFPR